MWAAMAIQLAWRRFKAHRSKFYSGPLNFAPLHDGSSGLDAAQQDRLRMITAMMTCPKPTDNWGLRWSSLLAWVSTHALPKPYIDVCTVVGFIILCSTGAEYTNSSRESRCAIRGSSDPDKRGDLAGYHTTVHFNLVPDSKLIDRMFDIMTLKQWFSSPKNCNGGLLARWHKPGQWDLLFPHDLRIAAITLTKVCTLEILNGPLLRLYRRE